MLAIHTIIKIATMILHLLILRVWIQFSKCVFCSTTCSISNSIMRCKGGDIPFNVPYHVREVFLEDSDLYMYKLKAFEDVSHVQKLDITAKKGFISAGCFYRFSNLSYLGIHIKEHIYMDQNAFEGLSTIKTLNLSSNPRLNESSISNALNSENREILPNLVHLSISRIKTFIIRPVDLDYYFFKSITKGRKLRTLDVSHLNILRVDLYSVRSICKSIEYIDLSKSVIASATNIPMDYTCQSLKSLDLSGMILPVLRTRFSFHSFRFFCHSLKFYENLNTILLDNVYTEHDIVLTNYSLEMSACPLKFQKVSFAGNRVRWANLTANLHETTIQQFTELNASDNGMEYISQSVLLPSKHIRKLDFSNNKLNLMQEHYADEFEKLFWAQGKLEYLYLSHNGLRRIPMKTFSNNKFLKILDISYNNIEIIDFSVSQLIYLEKLLLNNNKIRYIVPNVRNGLQNLLSSSSKVTDCYNKVGFHVNLDGNGFECNCDEEHQEFIKWLHVSEVIDTNESIKCILDGETVDVRRSAPSAIERFCRIEALKKIAMISVPFVVTLLVLVIVIAIKTRRLQRRKMIIRQVISQIEKGTFSMPYLAFLSYCSEDADLVLNTIHPKLQENFSELTHSNQNLVCIGDKHFRPGFPLLCEVMRCVEESSVLVAVVSRKFCQKRFCMVEIKEACEQNKPVVLLMVEHVEKELMEDFLQKVFDRYAHASWKSDENGGHIEPEWETFCKSILQLSGTILTKDTKDKQT